MKASIRSTQTPQRLNCFRQIAAKDFWPLYRDYRSAVDKIIGERMNLVLNYAKLYPSIPEDQPKQPFNTYSSLAQSR